MLPAEILPKFFKIEPGCFLFKFLLKTCDSDQKTEFQQKNVDFEALTPAAVAAPINLGLAVALAAPINLGLAAAVAAPINLGLAAAMAAPINLATNFS